MFRSLRIALLIAALCPFAARAAQFSVRGPGNTGSSGSTPVSVFGINFSTVGGDNCSLPGTCDAGTGPLALGVASAAADRGILKARSSCYTARTPFVYPGPFPNLESGVAQFEANDFRIRGPANPAGVPATLHMVLDGLIESIGFDQFGQPINYTSGASVGVQVGTHPPFFGDIHLDLGHEWVSTGILTVQTGPGGMSVALDLDLSGLPVDVDLSFSAALEAYVAGGGFQASSVAQSNFFDNGGLHFPLTASFGAAASHGNHSAGAAAVFTLPPGYTADIPSLNVVDNAWIGGTVVAVQPKTWGNVKNLYR